VLFGTPCTSRITIALLVLSVASYRGAAVAALGGYACNRPSLKRRTSSANALLQSTSSTSTPHRCRRVVAAIPARPLTTTATIACTTTTSTTSSTTATADAATATTATTTAATTTTTAAADGSLLVGKSAQQHILEGDYGLRAERRRRESMCVSREVSRVTLPSYLLDQSLGQPRAPPRLCFFNAGSHVPAVCVCVCVCVCVRVRVHGTRM
jgi:hypothetical protein